MGKKKRGHPDVEEILSRPWCYYCERDFDDLKILINHQKAKHFKCERCGRRLNTAGGLSVHMTQVHKETLTTIEHALPNRSNLDVEIFGMEGIPDDVVSSHNQRVLSQFAQAEAERRAATGNPGPGGALGGATKKPKVEDTSDLKKRLAEHKAKKTAEQAGGISSGDGTPVDGAHGSPGPPFGQNTINAGSPPFPQPQMPYGGPQNGSTYASYPQPYGQPAMPFQQPQAFPQQPPNFGSPPVHQFPQHQAFSPPQQFPMPGNPNFAPPQYYNGPPAGLPTQFSGGAPGPFGAGSPPIPFPQQSQYQPPRTQTPPQPVLVPQRTVSLQSAPGLPQRPSFGAPSVNAFQMQQMHQGQILGPPNPPVSIQSNQPVQYNNPSTVTGGPGPDLIQSGGYSQQMSHSKNDNGASQASQFMPAHEAQDKSSVPVRVPDIYVPDEATKATALIGAQAKAKPTEHQSEKKSKKEKEKDTKMIYSDDHTSPEEKMAKMSRYAFNPEVMEETVLGDATTAAVTGV